MRLLALLFGRTGRIGPISFGIGLLLNAVLGYGLFRLFSSPRTNDVVSELLVLSPLVIGFSVFVLIKKRSHDLGEGDKLEVSIVSIPIVDSVRSIYGFIRLLTTPGEERSNKCGNPPRM
jgi:uncharacterized membrane protein YhaH (DUF805 family)